jgi:hypothetical protein
MSESSKEREREREKYILRAKDPIIYVKVHGAANVV